MLTYGIAIDRPNDPLQKIDIEMVVNKIKKPRPEFSARIDQLRQIRLIDEKQYRLQKTKLPYFCCGIFNPPHRRKENFASIQYFTLDFDHFSNEHLSREETMQKLQADYNIRLLFTTPGGDGLKALFSLEEPCRDAGMYSHFYKSFAYHFSEKYDLKKVTDWVTHDVTRATFFSADPDAWDNPIATPVKMKDFITETISPGYKAVEEEFKKTASENAHGEGSYQAGSPDTATLVLIKSKLNPNYRSPKEKKIFVPEEINAVIPLIKSALEKEGIHLTEIRPIHFGKQLKLQMKKYWAEINVFYGKKGFSVVRTTKTGSNSELAEVAYQIADSVLNE